MRNMYLKNVSEVSPVHHGILEGVLVKLGPKVVEGPLVRSRQLREDGYVEVAFRVGAGDGREKADAGKVEPVETGWDTTTTAWRSSFLLPLNFFFVLVRDGGTMGLLAFFG